MFLLRLVALLPLFSHLVAAQDYDRRRDGHGGGNDNTSQAASASSSALSSSSTATPASQGSLTGDTQCSSSMCIAAVVNGSETTYVMSGLGKAKFGWMAIGFGTQMSNAPMVIMWLNNGNIIISQRKASGQVMPTQDSNPPRVASTLQAQSTISTTTPSLAFTIPSNSDTTQSIIYAYGAADPNSADSTANLVQHLDYGNIQLNLANVLSSNSTGTTGSVAGSPTSTAGSGGALIIPLAPYEKLIIAHAIICTVGFLLLLPAGVLLARYLRTFITTWFKGHWIVQFGIAGVVIVIGVALGIAAVSESGASHFNDDHKKWGFGLAFLYFVQCGIGAFIHFVKKADRTRRPPQNYIHAVLGIAIIGLSVYQVHSGYDSEWIIATGRDALPTSVNVIFWIWTVLLIASYAVGLAFLPKQFRQERAKVTNFNDDDERNHFNLSQSTYQYQKAAAQSTSFLTRT